MSASYDPGRARNWIERAVESLPGLVAESAGEEKLSFYINAFEGDGGKVRRILVTAQPPDTSERVADAVVILSRNCAVQSFPPDLSSAPILLRSPVKSVAFRVAMEHVANRLGRTGRGAAHPGFA